MMDALRGGNLAAVHHHGRVGHDGEDLVQLVAFLEKSIRDREAMDQPALDLGAVLVGNASNAVTLCELSPPPPTPPWKWHATQDFALKTGPNPSPPACGSSASHSCWNNCSPACRRSAGAEGPEKTGIPGVIIQSTPTTPTLNIPCADASVHAHQWRLEHRRSLRKQVAARAGNLKGPSHCDTVTLTTVTISPKEFKQSESGSSSKRKRGRVVSEETRREDDVARNSRCVLVSVPLAVADELFGIVSLPRNLKPKRTESAR